MCMCRSMSFQCWSILNYCQFRISSQNIAVNPPPHTHTLAFKGDHIFSTVRSSPYSKKSTVEQPGLLMGERLMIMSVCLLWLIHHLA